jgi:hypothetical protein
LGEGGQVPEGIVTSRALIQQNSTTKPTDSSRGIYAAH